MQPLRPGEDSNFRQLVYKTMNQPSLQPKDESQMRQEIGDQPMIDNFSALTTELPGQSFFLWQVKEVGDRANGEFIQSKYEVSSFYATQLLRIGRERI